MEISDIIQIIYYLGGTIVIISSAIKYLVISKIDPIKSDISKLAETIKNLEAKIDHSNDSILKIKENFVQELKGIAKENYEFRIRHDNSINDIKITLAERYICKQDIQKELDELKTAIEKKR